MTDPLLKPVRAQLALAGFGAVYTPVVLLLSAGLATRRFEEETISTDVTTTVVDVTTETQWPLVLLTAAALAPVALALAWWWSGRAIRPIGRALEIQQHMMEEASHELRTPLSVLTTNADVLLDHPEPSMELYREGLARSRRAALGMTATVEALLVDARGRARTIERRPLELSRLVDDVLGEVQPLAGESGITLSRSSAAPVRARVDGPTVERAIANLVVNAIEHGPAESTVDVRVDEDGDYVVITVTDEGPGIDPEVAARVFDRYWRSTTDADGGGPHPTDQGAGIGLAVVRQVAGAHGGDVSATGRSDGRSGAVVELRLRR